MALAVAPLASLFFSPFYCFAGSVGAFEASAGGAGTSVVGALLVDPGAAGSVEFCTGADCGVPVSITLPDDTGRVPRYASAKLVMKNRVANTAVDRDRNE